MTYLSTLIEKSVFFSQRDEMPLLSQQQKKIEDALVPFPLYCCVHVKHNVPAKEYCGEEGTEGYLRRVLRVTKRNLNTIFPSVHKSAQIRRRLIYDS